MKPRSLTIHWIALAVLSLLVLTGALAAHISSSPAGVEVALIEGRKAQVPVFRLLPDAARITLEFRRTHGQERPELGYYSTKSGSGYIEFSSPGEAIIIQVRGPDSSAEYEAFPTTGYGARHLYRDLVVRDNDGNPNRFAWPPDNAARPTLPAGWSTVQFTVVSAGEPITGEVVRVLVEPPLSFKSSMPGYGFLWWFFFWPVFALPLACYCAYLSWQAWSLHRRSEA